jgi:hypothetical protein
MATEVTDRVSVEFLFRQELGSEYSRDPIEPIVRSAQPYLSGLHFDGRGNVGTVAREFLLGVGQGAHGKHQFRAGDTVSGDALPVIDPPTRDGRIL